jgi:hypothetical protein
LLEHCLARAAQSLARSRATANAKNKPETEAYSN